MEERIKKGGKRKRKGGKWRKAFFQHLGETGGRQSRGYAPVIKKEVTLKATRLGKEETRSPRKACP